mgnify:FL=1
MIWTMVALGLALFVATFIIAWNATADYRENISRPQSAQSETISDSLQA